MASKASKASGRSAGSRPWGAVLGAVVCAGLVVGTVSPSWAGESRGEGEAALVAPFPLGGAVQGAIDPRTGAFSFDAPLGALGLSWDSRALGADSFALGAGWSLAGIARVETKGGVRVHPSKSPQLSFAASESAPSGLDGYEGADVRFSQVGGMLPARADGAVGERPYAFVLRELRGLVSYFDASGMPIAKFDAHDNRMDWEWPDARRLGRVVTADGVVTSLDWSDPSRVMVESRAGVDGPSRAIGAIELEGTRISGVVDATGDRTAVRYAASGLVSQITTGSGAATDVRWRAAADGTATVDRVSVVDPSTAEQVIDRRWEPVAGLASGWPAVDAPTAGLSFTSMLTDGSSRVTSTYDGSLGMTARDTSVVTPSGDRSVQRQTFSYPEGDMPAVHAGRPSVMELTATNASGATRTTAEGFVFDAYGRVVERTAPDRSVTTTTYDAEVPEVPGLPDGTALPVGLPLVERTASPDGWVSETRYALSEDRTSVAAVETFAGASGEELVRTGRSEFEVDADGFVTAERVYGQGGEGAPVVTLHSQTIDLVAGTVTMTDTAAAGTPLASTTSEVVDLLHGQPVAATDALGNTSTVVYDAAGRPVEMRDAAGFSVRTAYRSRQSEGVNATVTSGPDGVTVVREQDVIGRLSRTTDNIRDGVAVEGHTRVSETREYPSTNSTRVTDAWGWETTTEQDAFGRTTRATVSNGLSQVVDIDEVAGTQSSGTTMTGDLDDAELVTTQQIDLRGQVTGTSAVRADGLPSAETLVEFDGLGRKTRSSDGVTESVVEYDAQGNPVTTTFEPAGEAGAARVAGDQLVASRRFDERGASVEKTLSAAGESRTGGSRKLDLLGRVTRITDQVGEVSSLEYTADGLVARQETTAGAVTTNTYDPVTRLLMETLTTSPVGADVRTGFTYDPVTRRNTAVFDPADPGHTTIRYAYDAWGNVTEIAYPDGRSVRHDYDANGRKTATTDVNGVTTRFEHDPSGLLSAAVQVDAEGSPVASVRYQHDDYGRVTAIDRGNGVHTELTFTSASQIASETTTGPDGRMQSAREYAYDPHGNLATRTDRVVDQALGEQATTTSYAYDLHHRLVRSAVHEGTDREGALRSQTEYTLNVSGDVIRERVVSSPGRADESAQVRDLAYSPTGQLSQITTTGADGRTTTTVQEYDAAGNLTLAADGTRYAYNALNLTVQEVTPDGTTLRTTYWATGDRASLTSTDEAGEHTTGFYWDDGTMLNDVHTAGGATRSASYLLGVAREARTLTDAGQPGGALDEPAAAGPVYAVHDRHGNTTELTSAAGVPTSRFGYTDYGSAISTPAGGQPDGLTDEATRFPFLYAGEYTNPTGTQHLAVRTYAPDRFGFTSLDTEELQNKYGYADANPIMNVDPTGHFAWNDVFNGIVIGAALLFSVVTAGSGLGMAFTAGSGLVATITANAASFAFGGLSLLAGATGTAIATYRFIAEHTDVFVDEDADKELATAEYVLAGFGALTSIAGVVSSPKVVDRLSKAWKSLGSPAAAPRNVHVDARWLHEKLMHDDVLLPTLPGANQGVQNVVTRFLEGTRAAIKQMNKTKVISTLRVDSAGAQHPVLEALDSAQSKLQNLWWDYWRTAQNSWKGGPPLGEEVAAYITTNRPAFLAIANDVTTTVKRAREGGAVQEWLNELIAATEPPAEFAKHSDYLTVFGRT